ncbi:hypothetical protein, partial [Bartonella sp. AA89HNZF]|uniref:hypothetical protein n=1 Tax=Bartonella sp. AA89HNZF TaxID=3243442 RepID=UPI0035D09805
SPSSISHTLPSTRRLFIPTSPFPDFFIRPPLPIFSPLFHAMTKAYTTHKIAASFFTVPRFTLLEK